MTGFLWGEDSDQFFAEAPARREPPQRVLGKDPENPLSVTQLNATIKKVLDSALPSFWLEAEIGSLTRSGAGHIYLTLKDATNQVSAVLWKSVAEKLKFQIQDGMAVLCMGRVDVYGPRGTYQVILQRIEPQGIGSLQLALRQLHAKLEAEGLFRPERKRALPAFPARIGFVTSPHGAAIHDFLEVARRRWPAANILVIPAKVQGAGAAEQIAEGIRLAERIQPPLDVLVVGRGGGSMEDLWCFNEEPVVRAVAQCSIPTVSAVGHEIDVTLCDLAADVRALTPSEAAERVVPNRDEWAETLIAVRNRAALLVHHKLRECDARIQALVARPVMVDPMQILDTPAQRIDELEQRLQLAITKRMETHDRVMEVAAARLDAISPLRTLARGYSFTTDAATGAMISGSEQLRVGQLLQTRWIDGVAQSRVESIGDGTTRHEPGRGGS